MNDIIAPIGATTLGDHLRAVAGTHGDARAVFNDGASDTVVTLGNIADQALRLAGGLQRLGLRAGDVFAVQMPTRPATMVAHAAAAALGLVLLPIIHIYEGNELAFILEQSGARALLSPAAWRKIDFAARRSALACAFPGLLQIIDGAMDAVPIGTTSVTLADVCAGAPLAEAPAVAGSDVAMLIYTSGTTSQPKGVQHSHAGLIAELTADTLKRTDTVSLSPWPPGHIAGVLGLLRFWAMARPGVYMEQWHGRDAARLIETYRVTASSGTPFHITTLLDAAENDQRDISTLVDYMAGATMIPPALIQRCQSVGLATYRCYGLSEHPTVSSGSPGDSLEKRLGTDGRLNPGVEVRIADDDGRALPQGAEGEILTRGPDRFIGYRDPAMNAAAFTEDGWLRTGDIGRLDADGYLSITDRKKDIIIRGGENIASREVEDILSMMPGVRDSAVVGLPDALLGERIAAFIVADATADISLEAVAAHFAGQKVARQKTPEWVARIDELPRNTAGKVLKPDLRARLRG